MIRVSIAEAGKAARLLTFSKAEVTLGRDAHHDLRLTGKGVSGTHCRIIRNGDAICIEDLGSTNGTFVNRVRIAAPTPVTSADEVVVAIYQLRVLSDAESGLHRMPQPPGPGGAQVVAPPGAALDATGQQLAATGVSASSPTGPMGMTGPTGMTGPMGMTGPTGPMGASSPTGVSTSSPSGLTGAPSPSAPGSTGAVDTTGGAEQGRSVKTRISTPDDLEWTREWEQIDRLATEWFRQGRPSRLLLRGAQLAHARKWLARGRGKHPQPTSAHRQFIDAGARRRGMQVATRLLAGAVVLGGVGTVGGLAYLGKLGIGEGSESGDDDGGQEVGPDAGGGEDGSLPAKSGNAEVLALVERAATLVEDTPDLAALLAAEAASRLSGPDAERIDHPAALVLREALARIASRSLLGHEAPLVAAAISPDGRLAATSTQRRGEPVRLWNLDAPGVPPSWPLSSHAGRVGHMHITDDGRWLVTADDDGMLLRWSITADDPPSTGVEMDSHRAEVTSIAATTVESATWLVSGDASGKVRLWRVDDAHPSAQTLGGHETRIFDIAIAADGGRVAAVAEDGTGRVWTIDAGVPRSRAVTLARPEELALGPMTAVAISPDGQWVLTGDSAGTGWLWKAGSARPLRGAPPPLEGQHKGAIRRVGFSRDGAVAITGGGSKITLWDMGRKIPSDKFVPWEEHKGELTGMDVSGPGPGERTATSGVAYLVTASEDGTARRWNLDAWEGAIEVEVFGGHTGSVDALDVSRDGQWAVTGSADRTARVHAVWRGGRPDTRRVPGLGAAQIGWGHAAPIRSMAMNVGGNRMVTGSDDGTARVWDLRSPSRLTTLDVLEGHDGAVRAVAIDPGANYIATGASGGDLRLWKLDPDGGKSGHLALKGHDQDIRGLAFARGHGKKLLISAGTDGLALLWDMTSADPNASVIKLRHDDELVDLAVSADGHWLLTATGTSKEGVLWDLTAENPGAGNIPLKGHSEAMTAVALGPKGRWAATGSRDYRVHLYDLATVKKGKPKRDKLRTHEAEISALAFSANGDRLATADANGKVFVWDLNAKHIDESGDARLGAKGRLQSLAWSADGRWLVGASADRAIYVWPAEGGDPVVLEGHEGVVSGADITRDARFVASAGYDGTARLWPLTAPDLVPLACTRAGRWLTEEEWAQHVPGEYTARCSAP